MNVPFVESFGLEVEELVDNYSYFFDNHELVLNDFLTYIKRKNGNYFTE